MSSTQIPPRIKSHMIKTMLKSLKIKIIDCQRKSITSKLCLFAKKHSAVQSIVVNKVDREIVIRSRFRQMNKYVLPFVAIDISSTPIVGSKAANLGEMAKAGFPVPNGFCITTETFKRFVEASNLMDTFYNRLEQLDARDINSVRLLGEEIRSHIESYPISEEIQDQIKRSWENSGKDGAYAVRSSATAEDLPTASFAGQQDTYLNVIGFTHLLRDIKRCWASLFTDRAIIYRSSNHFSHHSVLISVIVQEMVIPDVSGIMFTADPVTGNRKIVSIDASYGLGEAIVSGIVSADLYKVKSGDIIQKKISEKKVAIFSELQGGTTIVEVEQNKRFEQAVPDQKMLKLVEIGLAIQKHFGVPQDIEWCIREDQIYIVQSRPITTLFPLPPVGDDRFHIYASIGHQQMMTDAMRPLGISILRTFCPLGHMNEHFSESTVLLETANRIYLDLTNYLVSIR